MALSPGTRLGPYEVLAPLGAGGMGEVYRARDTRLGRDVAVKVLTDELADDPKALARFQAEARAVAALSHPNILGLFDVGEESGIRYAVTELLEGETLRVPLKQGALPVRRALEIAGQIADGLAAAHGKGIVHRDLKPENVFLTKDGHAKILDFGLARQRPPLPSSEDNSSPTFSVLTDAGTVLGTFAYMSPEQASGKPVDHRSDQFSLGVVLYEMLTGKRPFAGATAAETLAAVIREEPEPLETGAPKAPAPVRWLVERLLSKDPHGRYDATRDLARELKTWSLHASEGGMSTGSARNTEQRGRGWRRLVLPASLVVLAAVAGATVGVILGRGPFARTLPEPSTFRPLTFSGQDEHAAASPDGKTIAFASTREEVRRIWLKQIDSGSEVAVTEGPNDDSPRFSPDGTSILFNRRNGTDSALHRVATLGGAARRVVEKARDADWSADGKRIVFLRGTAEVWTATSDGGAERRLASLGNDYLVTPRWSPDGRRIALILAPNATPVRGGLHVLDAATGEDSPVDLPPDAGRTFGIAWADRGETLLYTTSQSLSANISRGAGRIVSQRVRSSTASTLAWLPALGEGIDIAGRGRLLVGSETQRQGIREITPGLGDRWLVRGLAIERQPRYSPNGKALSFTSNRAGGLDIWDISLETGALRRLTDHSGDDWDPAYSRDGRSLVFTSNRTGHFEVWISSADGSNPKQVSADGVDAENPSVSTDGEWIVYSGFRGARPGLWKVHPDGSGETVIVPDTKNRLTVPEVSPDGSLVAIEVPGNGGMLIHIVRLADGSPFPFEQPTREGIPRPHWMPDGRSLVFKDRHPGGPITLWTRPLEGQAPARRLPGFEGIGNIETFDVSPDGKRFAVSVLELSRSVLLVENVPGVVPPARIGR